ncbi:MAG: SH3 domain-containing protein [Clostridia bacterium]|nr:SH3 domain-containing protein [Clostridia bacterium]
MKKTMISVLIVLLLVTTLMFTLTFTATAAEESVIDVITALANGTYSSSDTYLKYKVGNYFNSKVVSACSPHTSSNGCPDKTCIYGSVTINGTSYSGTQCMGFAYDIFRIIYGERYEVANIAATKIAWDGVTDPATWIKNTAQPGDYIRFGGHSAIVVGITSQYLKLYEANGYYAQYQTQPCRVTINANRTWNAVSDKISKYGGSLFIWRANINSSPPVNDLWLLSPPDGVLSMRTGATTSATKILDIPGDTYVTVTKYANDGKWDWGYVTYNGQSGWVCLYYATKHTAHSYGSWQTATAASCTATGSKTRTCACGAIDTQSIAALGHDYSPTFTVDKAATCTVAGSKSKHCTRCTATTSVTAIPATGHSYGSWKTVTAATCTSAGLKTCTCTCGAIDTQSIAALGHDYSPTFTVDKAATCTVAGSKSKHCTRCTATTSATSIPATGHSWLDWIITKQATYDSTGTKARSCAVLGCSAQESAVIAKLSLDGHSHKFGEWEIDVAATCTKSGSQKRTCSVCKSYETQGILALGHSFGEWITEKKGTCTEGGSQKRICDNCSEADVLNLPAQGHFFGGWVVKLQATTDADGMLERTCSNCSEVEAQTIPKLNSSSSVSNSSNDSIASTTTNNDIALMTTTSLSSESTTTSHLNRTTAPTQSCDDTDNGGDATLWIVLSSALGVSLAAALSALVIKKKK